MNEEPSHKADIDFYIFWVKKLKPKEYFKLFFSPNVCMNMFLQILLILNVHLINEINAYSYCSVKVPLLSVGFRKVQLSVEFWTLPLSLSPRFPKWPFILWNLTANSLDPPPSHHLQAETLCFVSSLLSLFHWRGNFFLLMAKTFSLYLKTSPLLVVFFFFLNHKWEDFYFQHSSFPWQRKKHRRDTLLG